MNWKILLRKIHYWGAIIIALPIIIVICTGILLQLKKDIDWIQPPTIKGQGNIPALAMEDILAASMRVPGVAIDGWSDIDRIDIRPGKGVLKVRAKNRWEIQLDHQSGEVLHVAYRRSDIIESIHDGSFFHDSAKLWVFLPAALILFILWITGMYLFFMPVLARRRANKKAS